MVTEALVEYHRKQSIEGAMQSPKRYDENNLIEELKLFRFKWGKWFSFWREWEESSKLDQIIRDSVNGSTFRAFRKCKKPAETFREWAEKFLTDKRLEELRMIKSQPKYSLWLNRMSGDLRANWKKKMSYGHSMKLSNLLMKKLCNSNKIPPKTFNTIVKFLEVPLDKYTIQAVADCPSIKTQKDIPNIRKNDGMGLINDNKKMYKAFQVGIRNIAKNAHVPPIALDLLVWNQPLN